MAKPSARTQSLAKRRTSTTDYGVPAVDAADIAWPHEPPAAAPLASIAANTNTPPDSYLSVRDVADRLACHLKTVRFAIKRGDLAAIRIGANGHYRIALGEFERFCAAHQQPIEIRSRRAVRGSFTAIRENTP